MHGLNSTLCYRSSVTGQRLLCSGSSPSAGVNKTIDQGEDEADFGPVAIDVASACYVPV